MRRPLFGRGACEAGRAAGGLVDVDRRDARRATVRAGAQAMTRVDGGGIALHQRLDAAVAAGCAPSRRRPRPAPRRPSTRGSRRPAPGRGSPAAARSSPAGATARSISSSAVTVLTSVISPRSSAASISSTLERARSRGTPRRRAAPRRASSPSARKISIASVEYETTGCTVPSRVQRRRRVTGLLDQLALRGRERRLAGVELAGRELDEHPVAADSGTGARRPAGRRRAPARSAPRRDARCTRASPRRRRAGARGRCGRAAACPGTRTRSRAASRRGVDRRRRGRAAAADQSIEPVLSDRGSPSSAAPRAYPARASSRSAT